MAGRRRVRARRGRRGAIGGGRASEASGHGPRGRWLLCGDLLLLPLAAYLSFVLRLDSFGLGGSRAAWVGVLILAGLTVVVGPLVFHRAGLYALDRPETSLHDVGVLAGATLAVSALVALPWWAASISPLGSRALFPRSTPVLLFFLTLTVAGLPRLAAWLPARHGDPVSRRCPADEAAPHRSLPIRAEDLLHRAPLEADLSAMSRALQGRRVLVTGAGGSIGSELCRRILRLDPAELVLLGHGEHSIFTLHREMEALLAEGYGPGDGGPVLHRVIADICDAPRLTSVFQAYRPEIVFHAAAHKHVPLMELNPTAAASNNVLGTRNVVAAARLVGVERFVLVSTDKAVSPRSVMGATKRAAELIVHRAALGSDGRYLVARFGNVIGSRGSVLRTMQEQIAAGGPVTVTDPQMTRYFMTVAEAASLLLQAVVLGRGGEVFTVDMGQPVRILDLAEDLIRLAGLRPGEDVAIAITGIRPGEKLREELRLPGEHYRPTAHPRILVAAQHGATDGIETRLRALEEAVRLDDRAGVIRTLKALVPEFAPDDLHATAPPNAVPPPPDPRVAASLWVSP
ncbi:MAG TPA: polysaccharide biosynthesis protein [Thermomicrobiaceae bacterium]|nr:polysaccharide biosynthesis protein [Thermomicrobiaceae bacterium]